MMHKCRFLLGFAVLVGLVGCGGGKGTTPTTVNVVTGTVEGYVYVPDGKTRDARGVVSSTRSAPIGYKALAGADVTVTCNGVTVTAKTDLTGHFKVGGLPEGTAQVHVEDPSGTYAPFDAELPVKGNTTASVGSGGQVSLVSHSADHLGVKVDRVDTTSAPSIAAWVSVTDPVQNTPIIGLTKANFQTVSVGGQPVSFTVQQFSGTTAVPAAIGLVQDCSGSMDGQPLDDAKASLTMFVDNLTGDDVAELITFDDYITHACPFTKDKSTLKQAINAAVSGGSTALYDAIAAALDDVAARSETRKAVVVMTDGGENASHIDRSQLSAKMQQRAGIPIYAVGLGFTRRPEPGARKATRSARDAESDLQSIAAESGGEYYFAAQSSDLLSIYTKITARKQQQYRVNYRDTGSGSRTLSLEVKAFALTGDATTTYLLP